jgi:hypothetical protein
MTVTFNPFTGNFDFVGASAAVPDPLTVNNLTVNALLTANHIHGNLAGSVYIHVKNLDTTPLTKGTPFYISGTVGSSDRVEVKRADADGSGTGPAVGLVESTLAVNGEGNGVIVGEIFTYDTATPGWTTNDPLYVSATGDLTNVRPTTGYRQVVGYVGRVHASTGTIVVSVSAPEVATDITYDAATREVRSSTGTDATLPLVSTSSAGLRAATSFSTITYGATVALNLASLDAQYRTISLTGNLELTTSNLANGRTLVLRLVNDATQRNLTFPTDWKFLGTKPANIAVSKTAVLSITAFGTTNADVVAAYTVQS